MLTPMTIPRDTFALAGNLHLPETHDPDRPGPAVVLATPGSSVKEQIGGTYARRLATSGIAALTFDPAYQGASGGEPRDREDPYRRSEDLSYAVDALSLVPGIDPDRIGAVGICAGGGYAVHAARTDHRIKALATVVATNMGRAWRSAAFAPQGPAARLDELAGDRTREVKNHTYDRVGWLPDTLGEAKKAGLTDDIDTRQALTYYRTPRGAHPRSTNRRLSRSDSLIIGFDAFAMIEELLTQPVQVVVGGRRGSTPQWEDGHELYNRAPNAIGLKVINGAGHYQMYDEPHYVRQAALELTNFFMSYV